MDPGNKSIKEKHFQTVEKMTMNGKNTKREKIGLSYKQRQKNLVNVVQIMGKCVMLTSKQKCKTKSR